MAMRSDRGKAKNGLHDRYFLANGGRLLQDLITSCDGRANGIRVFSAEELRKATNNYSDEHILGNKESFTNYKGTHEGRAIVVRKPTSDENCDQDMNFVFNEIVMLSQISHINIVKLLGCCLETKIPLRVFEFICNRSLYYHIHDVSPSDQLPWPKSLKITIEAAVAITYLHTSTSRSIVHRHITSRYILLDQNYNVKLANFRISAPILVGESKNTDMETGVKGTLGHIDPEYFNTGRFTEKSDVYGFGLVLLELLTGKKVLDHSREDVWLGDLVISSMNKKQLVSVLDGSIAKEGVMGDLEACANIAVRCLRWKGNERPTMREVVQQLKLIERS